VRKEKIGIVSYLNTRPLIYGLQREPIKSRIELIEDTPARLADLLETDQIDIGLIPVATIPRFPDHYIIGDYCIATDAEVASVCLFSEVPLEKIERIYLDYQSRSSVALLKWLMKESWGISPQLLESKDASYLEHIQGTTAGLVIGDRALRQRKVSTFIYDLGLEWRKITGLPFVFAAWVSKRPKSPEFVEAFNTANAYGIAHLDWVLAANPFPDYDLRKYFTIHISYQLDEAKRAGLDRFLQVLGTDFVTSM